MAKKPIKSKTTKSEFQLQQEEKVASDWLESEITKSQDKPISGLIELTPALARVLVQRNPDNRHISWGTVERFARDISNNAWVLNGEPIIIASDGLLNDGQHRAQAVIAADKGIQTIMIVGVVRDTRTTLDQGRMRTIGDYLAMEGHSDTVNLGSVGSAAWQWKKFGFVDSHSSPKLRPTKGEVKAFVDSMPLIGKSLEAIPQKGSSNLGGRAMLAFCRYAFCQLTPKQEADNFIYSLINGDNLSAGSPVLYARNRLMGPQRMTMREKTELIFRAWNAWRKDEDVRSIALQGGELPLLEA